MKNRRTPDEHRTDTGQTPDGHRTDILTHRTMYWAAPQLKSKTLAIGWVGGGSGGGRVTMVENNAFSGPSHRFFPQGRVWQQT